MKERRVTATQLEAAARIAKSHGVSITLKTDGTAVVSPLSADQLADQEVEREFADYQRKHGYL
ncbi:hypothetical protein NGM99_12565 [Mesorhizobium sp. RP14(2022)]|uniref:Uncharacterized protein n=1 Tax=Mesorhizobium liriopis TaxID=2953882 RepID=A0ABT1C9G7_9HYPH|nr:hypothetical protein [Mesorhizobium liriopis]MCO6050616.1 hypothetical protein [Mesorhizobium liriopis]